MQHKRFHYTSAQQFIDDDSLLNTGLPFSGNVELLGRSICIGGKEVKNRLLAQPIEGFDANEDGSPSGRTLRRYQRLVDGGVGCLWIESVSVDLQGRSNPYQLWITPNNVGAFADMGSIIRQSSLHRAYSVLQLTHSGRYSKPNGTPTPICAFSNPYIPKENEKIATDDDIRRIEDDYVAAALLAEQAGFDAIDIRACHGYLINEFFAAYERTGQYGGCFENRMRFLLNVIDKIRAVSNITIGVRLNVYDGMPYPFGWGSRKEDVKAQDMSEPLRLVELLYARGVRLINISGGVGAYSPYVIRPYDSGDKTPEEHPLEGVARLLGSARMVKQRCGDMVVVASGFTWLREYAANVASGGIREGWFDIAGFGRQAIAYPDFASDILRNGKMERAKCCTTCGGCTALIKTKGKKVWCVLHGKGDLD